MDATLKDVAAGPAYEAGTAQQLSAVALAESEKVAEAEIDLENHATTPDVLVDEDTYPSPTEEDQRTLRRVPDSIPIVAYVLCIAELAERASYYGASTVFNNFMQFPLPKGGNGTGAVPKGSVNKHAGALGKGLQFATAFGLLFTFLAYIFPILGAWIADVKMGRFKTIMLGVIIGGVAHVIMIGGAAPSVLKAGHGVAPFIISLMLLAVGAGIFKPNVAPLLLDQYRDPRPHVVTTKKGARQIVDPELTIQRIMLLFYCMINIGSVFTIATTYTEKYRGFWLSFLLPGIIYFVLPLILLSIQRKLVHKPATGASELTNFLRIVWVAFKHGRGAFWRKDFWANASPEVLAARGVHVPWTDRAVQDVQRTLEATVIFLYFPLYNLNDGGIGAVSSNQGAAMVSDGAPNDLLNNLNPVIIVGAAPILSFVVYPLLARFNIRFGPIRRMTFGFLLAAISGMCGALVQWRVYKTSPCGYAASTCDDVSPISIWWQLANVGLGAISELFCNTTAYELAFVRSPPHLKSVIMSIFLFTNALSSALGEILIPTIKDPHLTWVWAGPAIALFVQTVVFWVRHRHIDDEVYILEQEALVESTSAEPKGPTTTVAERSV